VYTYELWKNKQQAYVGDSLGSKWLALLPKPNKTHKKISNYKPTWYDVLFVDSDEIISVRPRLFVIEAKGMSLQGKW